MVLYMCTENPERKVTVRAEAVQVFRRWICTFRPRSARTYAESLYYAVYGI